MTRTRMTTIVPAIVDFMQSLPVMSQPLFAVLLMPFAAFISCFVIRGLFLWLRIRQLHRRLRIISNADLDSLAGLFAADPLRHLWS